MYTTWRATAAHGLLGVGTLLALAAALVAGGGGGSLGDVLAWLVAGFVGSGFALSWLHHREMERSRRHLARGLTHHMRTSLAHIRAYNEMLLLERDSSEDERRDWLEIVGREAERLGSAVENLLLIVNERRRDAYPVRRQVDLGELLEDVASSYTSATGPALRFPSGPPAGILVDVDPVALRQALGNLFESLSRSCGPGDGLSAKLSSDGETATVCVELPNANGGGSRPRNAFHVGHPEGATGEEFGLELAVVEHVAKAHGGRAVPFRGGGRAGYRLELPVS